MAKTSLEVVYNQISEKLASMTDRAKSTQAFFARVLYPKYQKAQISRWMTENSDQTGKWKPLNPVYEKYKKIKYAGFDYGGSKMLIATGNLFKSVVGPSSTQHSAIFTKDSMTISTSVGYAKYVAEVRPFMEFSDATIDSWQRDLQDFIAGI